MSNPLVVTAPVTKLAVKLRIAIVQLNPQIGQVTQNVKRATCLLNKLKESIGSSPTEKNPDLIVFPEFALTGYNFHSRDHILPYTSKTKDGPSYEMAKKVSKMFNCYTVIGYPERTDSSANASLYNSAAVIDPNGELVFNYRKSFLYYTDEDWGCQENPRGFQSFPLHFKGKARDMSSTIAGNAVDVTIRTSIGICMDLSPYKFEAPFHDYEFATYNIDNNIELIIFPMAWLHSSSVTKESDIDLQEKIDSIKENAEKLNIPIYGSQGTFQLDIGQHQTQRISRDSEISNTTYADLKMPDMSNVNYWILRFLPFLALKQRSQWTPKDLLPFVNPKTLRHSYMGSTLHESWKFRGKNAVVAIANRCGIEDGTTVYAGSSGLYKFNGKSDNVENQLDSTNKSIELLGNLGKGLEGVIMRDVELEVNR